MPDLIIKPKDQSGNKLILQDQAGGAVLTTADSGATIANATLTAPTVADMSNCTFPAGHIVQVVVTSTSNRVDVTNQAWTEGTTATITTTSNTHKVLALGVAWGEVTRNSGTHALGGIRLKSSGSGVTSQTFDPNTDDSAGPYGIAYQITRASFNAPINYLFSPAYEGVVTISIECRNYSTADSETMRYNGYGSTGSSTAGLSNLTLIEVVQ